MVLEKLEAIQDFIYLVGSKNVEDAKNSQPERYIIIIKRLNISY